jgi:hypothetical protein
MGRRFMSRFGIPPITLGPFCSTSITHLRIAAVPVLATSLLYYF